MESDLYNDEFGTNQMEKVLNQKMPELEQAFAAEPNLSELKTLPLNQLNPILMKFGKILEIDTAFLENMALTDNEIFSEKYDVNNISFDNALQILKELWKDVQIKKKQETIHNNIQLNNNDEENIEKQATGEENIEKQANEEENHTNQEENHKNQEENNTNEEENHLNEEENHQNQEENNTNEEENPPENPPKKNKYEVSLDRKILENDEPEESTQINATTIIHQEIPENEILKEINEIREAFEKFYNEKLSVMSCPIDFKNYFTVLDQFYEDQKYRCKKKQEFENEWLEFLKIHIDQTNLYEDNDEALKTSFLVEFDHYFEVLKRFLCENPTLTYKQQINKSLNDKPSKKIQRVLSKIFIYYCKKMRSLAKTETFEQTSSEKMNMNLNIFSIFLKDFKVSSKKLTIQKIVELYKKNSNNVQELTFENFMLLLKIIAQHFYPENGKSEEENYQEFFHYLEVDDLEKLQEKIPNLKQMMNAGFPKKIEAHSKLKNMITHIGSNKEFPPSNNNNEDKNGFLLETKEEQITISKVDNKKLDFKKIPQILNKPKDSYMLNQGKSFLNKINLKKEMTLKKLEDLSADNLKPFQDQYFNPEDMFDKNTGDDDVYLAEYSLNPKEKILKTNNPRNEEQKNENLQIKSPINNEKIQVIKAPNFGKSKSKSPPRQNIFEGNHVKIKENRNELMRSPISDVKKPDFKAKLLERAKKIDIESKEKENQIITKVMDYHNYKINMGLKVLKNKGNNKL